MKRIITFFLASIFLLFAMGANIFVPKTIWKDDQGIPINAHGGGICFYKGIYYWFGEYKGDSTNSAIKGVTCYSSTDLYHWKNESLALSVSSDLNSDITKGCMLERPKVVYNRKTKKFVMWFHLELKGDGYTSARFGVAVSDNVTGPYQYLYSSRVNPGIYPLNMTQADRKRKLSIDDYKEWWTPRWYKAVNEGLFVKLDLAGGQMSRDMTIFVDDDGTAYHVYSSEENLTIQIAQLTDDYLHHTGKYIRVAPGGHNEAPALMKYHETYWMITSGCTGWDPNAARMFSAPNIFGPWTQYPNPCVGNDKQITFGGQSTYIFQVEGMKDAYIFMADVWRPNNPIDGRYVWLPIRFNDGVPYIEWMDSWDLKVFSSQK